MNQKYKYLSTIFIYRFYTIIDKTYIDKFLSTCRKMKSHYFFVYCNYGNFVQIFAAGTNECLFT